MLRCDCPILGSDPDLPALPPTSRPYEGQMLRAISCAETKPETVALAKKMRAQGKSWAEFPRRCLLKASHAAGYPPGVGE